MPKAPAKVPRFMCERCGKHKLPAGQQEGSCDFCNAADAAVGAQLLVAYVNIHELNEVEARQDYTITDAICALLKLAKDRGFRADSLHRSALSHFEVEVGIRGE